ncbi:MGMT family protein [Marinilongibacter aquaticus]|uniref:MGMT family protein n=1 Tax=Marinilongibacter aquaticus TaxID=2975157 RepID=UPI0021BDC064|nr:MGMT family protein [Marinilongibacter aquaticus]UBM60148.1 MGMT family protein [Marinilongibacter aquaticus]
MNKFEEIYELVKLIPSGRVTSYGAIASYMGLKGGARLVGWAMNSLNGRKDVPAHRVVNRSGLLTGKEAFEGPDTMQKRLEAEGINVENNQVVDFSKVFWDPQKELL